MAITKIGRAEQILIWTSFFGIFFLWQLKFRRRVAFVFKVLKGGMNFESFCDSKVTKNPVHRLPTATSFENLEYF